MKRNKARVVAEEQKLLQEDLPEQYKLDKLDKLDLSQEGVSDEEATPKASDQAKAAFGDGQMAPLPQDQPDGPSAKAAKSKTSRLHAGSNSPPETPRQTPSCPRRPTPLRDAWMACTLC